MLDPRPARSAHRGGRVHGRGRHDALLACVALVTACGGASGPPPSMQQAPAVTPALRPAAEAPAPVTAAPVAPSPGPSADHTAPCPTPIFARAPDAPRRDTLPAEAAALAAVQTWLRDAGASACVVHVDGYAEGGIVRASRGPDEVGTVVPDLWTEPQAAPITAATSLAMAAMVREATTAGARGFYYAERVWIITWADRVSLCIPPVTSHQGDPPLCFSAAAPNALAEEARDEGVTSFFMSVGPYRIEDWSVAEGETSLEVHAEPLVVGGARTSVPVVPDPAAQPVAAAIWAAMPRDPFPCVLELRGDPTLAGLAWCGTDDDVIMLPVLVTDGHARLGNVRGSGLPQPSVSATHDAASLAPGAAVVVEDLHSTDGTQTRGTLRLLVPTGERGVDEHTVALGTARGGATIHECMSKVASVSNGVIHLDAALRSTLTNGRHGPQAHRGSVCRPAQSLCLVAGSGLVDCPTP